MDRHAYLIVAHNQWDLLKILMRQLDDRRNDIYLHVDMKSVDAPIEELKEVTRNADVKIIDRIPVHRGSFSLFEAEMDLLKEACDNGEYTFFHMLSGQDLPLRDQDYIHEFFAENEGVNFVDVISPDSMNEEWRERVSLFQLLSRQSLDNTWASVIAKGIRKITNHFQRMLHVDRFSKYEKQGFSLCFGSNWFSITRSFAGYLIENESLIRQMFEKYTFAPEELIPQTFLWSSEFRDTLYNSEELDHGLHRANLRLVFWNGKTSPETITMKHMDQIRTSTNLFARKFDYENHPDAVEAVIDMVNSGGH